MNEEIIKAFKYYTYELVDPRDNKVFYVGKGKGNRVYEHVKKVERSSKYSSNIKKNNIIKDILDSKLKVIERIVEGFDTQSEALDKEEYLISSHGINNLSNMYRKGNQHRYRKYHIKEFPSTVKLLLSMLNRFKSMQYDFDLGYEKTGILSPRERYDMICERFNELYNSIDKVHFMRIINKELIDNTAGSNRRIM